MLILRIKCYHKTELIVLLFKADEFLAKIEIKKKYSTKSKSC